MRSLRWFAATLMGLGVVLLPAAVSLAAKAKKGRDEPVELAAKTPIWAILVVVVALVGVCVVAFKNARRTQVD